MREKASQYKSRWRNLLRQPPAGRPACSRAAGGTKDGAERVAGSAMHLKQLE